MSRPQSGLAAGWSSALRSLQTLAFGLPGFFLPRPDAGFAFGLAAPPGEASFYDVAPLRETLCELACLGCRSVFHLVQLQAPRLPGEDHTKDIEFEASRVAERRAAGLAETTRALRARPWETQKVNRSEGIVVHDFSRAGGADS